MQEIVELLTKNHQTISAMESCTGGYFTNELTNIPGSSEVINFSAITYSNEYKIKLGVSPQTIEKYTVYSQEVANEMSKCISNYTNSDYGVGITGKLNRADPNNPYGDNSTIYISIYNKKIDKFYSKILTCTKENRKDNKELVIENVINILKTVIK